MFTVDSRGRLPSWSLACATPIGQDSASETNSILHQRCVAFEFSDLPQTTNTRVALNDTISFGTTPGVQRNATLAI
jgi:hypothetical protein